MVDTSPDGPEKLPVKDVFAVGSYRVPVYQRAYAWTKTEIHTLLIDIQDARKLGPGDGANAHPRKYYIGSLVVNTSRSEDEVVHEVVDGQQRLTTLFVILSVAPQLLGSPECWRKLIGKDPDFLVDTLSFEGRPDARDDLVRLARRGATAISDLRTDGIKNAAEIIEAAALRGVDTDADSVHSPKPHGTEDPSFTAQDLEYLLEHVMILRTDLPPGTDLNHYFEIMNTRGEQLEKHEILKARLIAALGNQAERESFSQIWDACSILDRHLHSQFSPVGTEGESERSRLFGTDWDTLVPRTEQELFGAVCGSRRSDSRGESADAVRTRIGLDEILATESSAQTGGDTDDAQDESGSYGTIIDFPNLLLLALKIYRQEEFRWSATITSESDGVRLEDKYLLEEFAVLRNDGAGGQEPFRSDQVREFAFTLFKTRYLLDTYVIRTQANTAGDHEENWVLHRAFRRPARGKQSQQLSTRNTFGADHSSTDHDGSETSAQRQILLLQSMFQVTDARRSSKYFLYRILRWLYQRDQSAAIPGRDFVAELESSAHDRLAVLYDSDNVNTGTLVQNFLFNVLDYELWRLASDKDRMGHAFDPTTTIGRQSAAALQRNATQFRFRYRTSVEHFYPSQPATGQGHKQLMRDVLDDFGNLCIMSRSENSRRNNLMPKAKAAQFSSKGQSLKFQIMAEIAKRDGWNDHQIKAHGMMMRDLLESVIETDQADQPTS